MNHISIAIVDDEKSIRNLYESYLNEWAQDKYKIRIKKFESAEEFLFKYEDDENYDLLLLDIEMKGLNGVDLAKKIREKDDKLQIVFISGYSEYISFGYDVNALHFLVKPIAKEKLFEILEKALDKSEKNGKFILVKSEGAVIRIYLNEIISITSDKNYLILNTQEQTLRIRMTIKEAMEKLDQRFFQIGRSDIINIEKIESFDNEKIIMDHDIEVLMPRSSFESLNRKLIEYF